MLVPCRVEKPGRYSRIGDGISDDGFKEGLEDTASLFVDHGRDTLDTTLLKVVRCFVIVSGVTVNLLGEPNGGWRVLGFLVNHHLKQR